MCGIIGCISRRDVFSDIFEGLVSLQHRGQDNAGIVVSDGKKLNSKKGSGLLYDVFGSKPEVLKGNMGIGHLRYPTAGSNINIDAQPLVAKGDFEIAMAHNGNLTNGMQLRRMLGSAVKLKTTADTELLLNVFSQNLKSVDSDGVFSAAKKIMELAQGSYCLVCLIEGHGIVAIRDPYGFMPLVLGKSKDSYCMASESVALQTLGYEFVADVMPGEVIFIDSELKVHRKQLVSRPAAHCMFQWVYFARPDSTIEGRSVYEARLGLGRELARKWKSQNSGKIDVVIPVPDTSRPAASAVADELGVPHREGLIKNRYIGRTFIMPTQDSRDRAVRLKLNPITEQIKGKSVAVVDDSIVRGTTSRRIVNVIRNAGARKVHFFVTCPPVKWPCFYGIDMSTRKELIASSESIEQIRKQIGADTLTYQDMQGLKNAIGVKEICTACLDGSYPTGLKVADVQRLESERDIERESLVC